MVQAPVVAASGTAEHRGNTAELLQRPDGEAVWRLNDSLICLTRKVFTTSNSADIEASAEAASTSEDSYFQDSESESEDSATARRREAEERLTNRDTEAAGPSTAGLPPPLDILRGAKQPDFLTPEATRRLAQPFHKSRAPLTKLATAAPKEQQKVYDIASMAPRLKGQTEAEKRGLPNGAVISAAAKKYKPDESSGIVTAAQVAMLGGQWRPAETEEPQPEKRHATKAMPVSDFLAQGGTSGALPRSRQDRKDREKEKRSRGQSSINGWKTEAEMVLRQQYD